MGGLVVRRAAAVPTPGLGRERSLLAAGYRAIAGIDEVGRGAWAGPLVAAAVVLPPVDGTAFDEDELTRRLAGVRDSKGLSPRQRERLAGAIEATALGVGVGWVPAAEIDRLGLTAANRLAWHRAVAALPCPPDFLLLDAFSLPGSPTPQLAIVRGDRDCLTIAAASIVAKVVRDRALAVLDLTLPGYGFGRHKGYGTAEHRTAIARHGPCAEHRRSFAPLRPPIGTDGPTLDTAEAPAGTPRR